MAVDSESRIFGLLKNFLKASLGLPHKKGSWDRFLTGLKDSFPSVGRDAGKKLRHGLSYGY